jgi:hypothetical protein
LTLIYTVLSSFRFWLWGNQWCFCFWQCPRWLNRTWHCVKHWLLWWAVQCTGRILSSIRSVVHSKGTLIDMTGMNWLKFVVYLQSTTLVYLWHTAYLN